MNDPMPQFIADFKEVSSILLEYGWFISPYMTGGEFEKIHDFCSKIRDSTSKGNVDKKAITENINLIMTDIIFQPSYRAFFVFRSKELPYIKEYSYFLERSILHYYKRDFLSCVLCLLPAIEGILLSYYGWSIGDERKPTYSQLIKKIEESKKMTELPERYDMYRSTLVEFLRKWIFIDTHGADFDISYLNRHYILHGMGKKCFYSANDCHRLILFFDLLIEYLSLEEKKYYIFIPDDPLGINIRREYYLTLIENDPNNKTMIKLEEEFMKENRNYETEKEPPKWADIQFRYMLETLEFYEKLERMRNQQK